MNGSVPEPEIKPDPRPEHRVGLSEPGVLVPVWLLLVLLLVAEAVHELAGVGSPDAVFSVGIEAFLVAASSILCLLRAAYEQRGREAWLWIGAGMAAWAIATVVWDLRFSSTPHPPYPTISDILWLAWYPLVARGMMVLIRERVKEFELHRWLDGLAVMLVVITPAVALIVVPEAKRSPISNLATVVDFSYPILDVLMIGGILGVCGLLGWRPGRTWILLGAGCAVCALADGVFSLQQARGGLLGSGYDFFWSAGALLIATAAWSSTAEEETHGEIYGWRAIALPLAAQLCAAGIQIYGLFHRIGRSERIVTLVVLLIAAIQIIISRPRTPSNDAHPSNDAP